MPSIYTSFTSLYLPSHSYAATPPLSHTRLSRAHFMDPSLASAALLSGLGAGAVAILATLAVERWGGTLGGVLATVPTTIVAACLGWGSRLSSDALTSTTAAVPIGMLIDAAVLLVWKFLPRNLPSAWSSHLRLAVVTLASLCVWLACAVVYAAVGAPAGGARAAVGVGGAATALLVAMGTAACVRLPPAGASSGGARARPSLWVLAARGVAAGAAIAVAVLLSAASPTAGGLAATFPAIFTTIQVSLWLSHGEALPLSATGPMVLGSASVAAYALMFAPLAVATGETLGAAVAAWVLAVALVSAPVARFLQWRQSVAGATVGGAAGGADGAPQGGAAAPQGPAVAVRTYGVLEEVEGVAPATAGAEGEMSK